MRILRYLAVSVMMSAVVFGACTSSNSPTSNNIQTNSSYDNQYRDQTRSSAAGNQPSTNPEEMGDPPITLMIIGMETGDVYPGEDYFVYVVDDNPDGRDLEYEWGIANGDIWPVAEADRGRLRTVVETEYNTAQPEVQQPVVDPNAGSAFADGTVPGGTEVPAGQAPPGAQAPAAGGQSATQPTGGTSTQQPTGSTNQQNTNVAGVPQGESADTKPSNQDLFNSGSTGSSSENKTQNTDNSGNTNNDVPTEEKRVNYDPSQFPEQTYGDQGQYKIIIPLGMTYWPDGTDFDPSLITILNKLRNNEALTSDEEIDLNGSDQRMRNYAELKKLGEEQSDRGSVNDGYILRRMVVAGQAVIDDEGRRLDNEVAGNVVDRSVENATAMLEEQTGMELDEPVRRERSMDDVDSRGLRYEYQDWQEDEGEARQRGLGGYGADYDDEDPLDADESFDRYSLITDDPYIQWTPRRPGRVNIWVRAMYHDEYVTEARNLEVEVRLRDPEVELEKDFPDVVREDEAVYVRIDGSNLPDFDKGLFTLSFDNTKLSFREAELGEFFDDFSDASIYFAQPNKDEGKVLIAVDSNTVISEPAGDGPLVYVKFKAKEDLETSDEPQLAMVMDTSARYILNKDGENVLPLPLNLPPWRTQTIMPPELPNYTRENTPGTQAGTVPSSNRTPPGAQAPTGNTTASTGTQTGSQVNQTPTSGGFTQDAGFLSSGGSSSQTTGGNTTGGNTTGGNTTGGNTTGGNSTGGNTTGGDTTGGNTTGGNTTGGNTTAGGDTLGRAQSDAEDGTEESTEKSSAKEKSTEPAADEPAGDDPGDDPAAEPEKPAEDPNKKEEPKKDE
ncbi:MAG: hypothetical protein H7A35_13630 [Planctomycetales bacterium]|nr:hypothetical protein [bacterium]UNM07883.1 MAG: hypothetical protein H7A35_13630 [Planctomycetales bacterium]